MSRILILLPILLLTLKSPGMQSQTMDTFPGVLLTSARYGAGLPLADLNDRFAEHFTLGGNVALITKKNITVGLHYDLIFGSQVKEDVLSNLRTVEGGIIGRDMQFASIFLRERGHHFFVDAGYLIPVGKKNTRSGFLFTAGIGYLSHKIRIVDDFNSVIQLKEPYLRGYDRLSAGWSLNQRISYLFLSDDKLINFYLTLSLTEAFTKDQRQFNYNQTEVKIKRFDVMTGIQAGWIIPVYFNQQTRYY